MNEGDDILKLYKQQINKARIIAAQCKNHPKRHKSDVEAAFDEAIVVVIERVNRDGSASIKNIPAYITKIMNNILIREDARGSREISASGEANFEQFPSPAASLDIRLLLEEENGVAMQAIMRLPRLQCQVFIARYIEEMSIEEIADFVQTTPANVRQILSRTRAMLRNDPELKIYCADYWSMTINGTETYAKPIVNLKAIEKRTFPKNLEPV